MHYPIPHNEKRRLEALQRYRILDTDPERSFDDFALLAATICDVPIAIMTFVDAERQWFKARVGIDGTETPREHAFCAHTIMKSEVMIIENATEDERFAQNPLVTGGPEIRFYAGAPLIDIEGNALGSLCVIDQRSRQLEPRQHTALQTLARQVIAVLELRRLAAEFAHNLQELKVLQGLLPICFHCKGIRDDQGSWNTLEDYITTHAEVDFSHCVCPSCLQKLYPQTFSRITDAK